MKTVTQSKTLRIVGLELRTTNETAFKDIPAHWQRFYQDGILEKIPNKVSADVYAVYTNFENPGKNNLGTYSLILGAEVPGQGPVPPGLVAAVVPQSKRQVFEVAKGHPEKVGEKWQEIWALGSEGKAYLADFEHYTPSGEIAIHVGVV
ncbi:GyrI-like domain-containing protein [Corallococcus sp. BB11-1]|uniref:GyrI-like domain-containing protein n=1 Tax=Corallococcus sp. BB11-1 TaxID=2996783 RepID=UPI0022719936|nr:GyrI-like domain-containing protein [Corallococcus sp. BB11-1]MCY1033277.1 GyrI-like domain-containing protein [Corallococcus sp. BB11-1]